MKYTNVYKELMTLTNSAQNYKTYREALKGVPPNAPVIPYVGVILKDLTFIQDGNDDYLEEGVINFDKMRMVSEIVRKVQAWQHLKFPFQPVEPIQRMVGEDLFVMKTDKALYHQSYLLEPQEGQAVAGTKKRRKSAVANNFCTM